MLVFNVANRFPPGRGFGNLPKPHELDAEEKMAQAAAENQSARDAVASEAQAQAAQLAGQLREEGERLRSELGGPDILGEEE